MAVAYGQLFSGSNDVIVECVQHNAFFSLLLNIVLQCGDVVYVPSQACLEGRGFLWSWVISFVLENRKWA